MATFKPHWVSQQEAIWYVQINKEIRLKHGKTMCVLSMSVFRTKTIPFIIYPLLFV